MSVSQSWTSVHSP